MIFYLDSKGDNIQEFLANNATYIGILGGAAENQITAKDISLDKINSHLENDEFLVCCVLNNSWWIAIVFNTADGANEIKTKHKGKPMLWYWIKRETLALCMHHMQFKEFNLIFPKKIN